MDRKEFLSQMGLGAASFIFISCLEACSKSGYSPNSSSTTPVNFNVDISSAAYAALQTAGGYVYVNGIIVAKTLAGAYIAVSQTCTHQGSTVMYDDSIDKFVCPAHGSRFNEDGSVSNGPAATSLKHYNVTVNGNILTITS